MKTEKETPKTKGTRWFGWLLVAIIVVMAAVIVFQRTNVYGTKSKDIVVLTEENFQEQINTGVTLVDVWAEWCKPCKAMEPAIDALAIEMKGKAVVAKLNADENRGLVEKLGVEVLPTIIILKNGQEVQRLMGMQTQETLSATLQEILNNNTP